MSLFIPVPILEPNSRFLPQKLPRLIIS